MFEFDREDFVQNVSDELQGRLDTIVSTVPLKKEGNASISFIVNKKDFSVSFDVCNKQHLQVTLFHGVGVDLSSCVIPSFNVQQYGPDVYNELLDSITVKVKEIAFGIQDSDTVH